MIFNSWQYAFFMPAVFLFYWLVPQRVRWIVLLLSSWIFYALWSLKYLLLLITLILTTYYAAIVIENVQNCKVKKTVFLTSVIICVSVLFAFKYLNFFIENASRAFVLLGIHFQIKSLQLMLPVGLSFYVFQMIAYVTDVYKGKIQAEHHAGYYAVFISFFPQLLSGPIGRGGALIPQYRMEKHPDEKTLTEGAKILIWGYFKKCVIADNLAVFVDRVYADLPAYKGFALALAAVFYSFQIYCDFSGYSDIAIGSARLLGIHLADNFKVPYLSQSIREFWSRWHVSLSQWFRDYIYIPLGGSRVNRSRECLNLMITFLVSGLWHGASWTFVFWGFIHGIARVCERLFTPDKHKSAVKSIKPIKTLIVFSFVTLAWVFFRAASIRDALYVISHMMVGLTSPVNYILDGLQAIMLGKKLLVCMIVICFLPLVLYDMIQKQNEKEKIQKINPAAKWFFYAFLGVSILLFTPKNIAPDFIYAQF